MKVVCSKCGKHAYGDKDSLIEKGWAKGYGSMNGKRFSYTECPECFNPQGWGKAICEASHKADRL